MVDLEAKGEVCFKEQFIDGHFRWGRAFGHHLSGVTQSGVISWVLCHSLSCRPLPLQSLGIVNWKLLFLPLLPEDSIILTPYKPKA